MQAQTQRQTAASEETILAFKRHILTASRGFAAEPMADLCRVHLLEQMLNRYEALRGKGMGEASGESRVLYEFSDIANRMRERGFEEIDAPEAEPNLSRWPLLTQEEADRYIQERDDYLHRQAMGAGLCSACVTPLMVAAAFNEVFYSDAFAMLGLVGMFAMIGMGVYAITTAVKPENRKTIRKGHFSLGSRVRRRLEQKRAEIERKARKRTGRGVAMLVTCVIPIFIGAALSEVTYSDAWPMLGIAGMFLMIGAGVYEVVMADGEKKTIKQLLKN